MEISIRDKKKYKPKPETGNTAGRRSAHVSLGLPPSSAV